MLTGIVHNLTARLQRIIDVDAWTPPESKSPNIGHPTVQDAPVAIIINSQKGYRPVDYLYIFALVVATQIANYRSQIKKI